VGRGVKQRSVLSPVLFLDKNLQEFAGGFLHADDVRTPATSGGSLERQAALVKRFGAENFLKLNVWKCEVVVFGSVEVLPCQNTLNTPNIIPQTHTQDSPLRPLTPPSYH
jgi:hypothetical protein